MRLRRLDLSGVRRPKKGDRVIEIEAALPDNVVAMPPRRTRPPGAAPLGALPPSLGQFLRAKREARQQTLTGLAKLTRISERTLRALEADEYQFLPADVFVRGYLRTLARVCGFDGAEALRYFESARGPAGEEAKRMAELAAQAARAAVAPPPPEPEFGWTPLCVMGAVLFLLALSLGAIVLVILHHFGGL